MSSQVSKRDQAKVSISIRVYDHLPYGGARRFDTSLPQYVPDS